MTSINIGSSKSRNPDLGSRLVTERGYELFPHRADIGIRGLGASTADAFAQAASALTSIVTEPDRVRHLVSVGVACTAPDKVTLFVDWINAIILEMDVRKMLFG